MRYLEGLVLLLVISLNYCTCGDQLDRDNIIPDREEPIKVSETHAVNGNRVVPPFPEHLEMAMIAMGCFWGVERKFWETPGVYSTHVGYSAGITKNPTYLEVKSGRTGHAEVVRMLYDPDVVTYSDLMHIFWENHDPTQGMRQGMDIGTQYRSGIYYYNNHQKGVAESSRDDFQRALTDAGYGAITTEINPVSKFYYAEEYHQQYLHKNPDGYCGLAGTGVSCPRGIVFNTRTSDGGAGEL